MTRSSQQAPPETLRSSGVDGRLRLRMRPGEHVGAVRIEVVLITNLSAEATPVEPP